LVPELSSPPTYREPAPACPTCKAPQQTVAPAPCAQCQEAAKRSAASAGLAGIVVGVILALGGLVQVAVALAVACRVGHGSRFGAFGAIGLVSFAVGVAVALQGRARGKHAAWVRLNGVPLAARVVDARWTGVRINGLPLFRFELKVAGPQGSYEASFRKLVRRQQAFRLVGQEVRVRANPAKLDDVVQED
jgi:hypothetical protein